MAGKRILEKGVMWRVGNGEDIFITGDKWIPQASSHPVQTTVYIPETLKVSAPIDERSKQWNEELVRACFLPCDAECILRIPLSHSRDMDCVSWPYTKSGVYTVKSAYMLAKYASVHQQLGVRGKGEKSEQNTTAKEWGLVWKVKAPPKMRIILWRFAHDCLPTGKQMEMRNIPANNSCCHCGRFESLEHTFIQCQYVTEIWKELQRRCGIRKLEEKVISPKNWLFDALALSMEMEATLIALTLAYLGK